MTNEAQATSDAATVAQTVTANEVQARLFRVADRSGYEKWILEAVLHATYEERSNAVVASRGSRDQAVAICCALVEGLGKAAPGRMVPLLRQAKLESSEDLLRILEVLAETDLVRWDDEHEPGNFAGIFHIDQLDEFTRAHGLKLRSQRWEHLRRGVSWSSYAVGGGVILSAWAGWIPQEGGRLGWLVLFVGWLVFSKRRNP